MKLATFTHGGATRIGVVEQDEIVDVGADARLPTDLRLLLGGGEEALAAVRAAVGRAARLPLAEVRLEAPIAQPRKFLGLGMSFKSHVAEVQRKRPDMKPAPHQIWFNKQVSAVTGPYDPIHLPRVSTQFDYEGELAVVIGRHGRHVRKADAHRIIAGFMVTNDLSVRDWQFRSPTSTLGKSFDTHAPIGPWLTTADEIGDPHALRIRTWVDDELRQDGNTDDFIYSLGEMIEELTTAFTLEPGDILATGSPPGVGALMTPPTYLTAGQTVRIEIEGLGAIANPVIDEPATERS